MLAKFVVIFEQGRANLLAGFTPDRAETEGQHELSVAGRKIDLSGAGDVAVFCALVFPLHLEMSGDILPSVGDSDESD